MVAPGPGNNGVVEPDVFLEANQRVEVNGLGLHVRGSTDEGFRVTVLGLDGLLDMVFGTVDDLLEALPTQPS